jgi:anti-anti-sigma regulatory factor
LLGNRLASLIDVLVIDVSTVSFLSVSGLELLSATVNRAHSRGVRPELVAGTHPVRRALEVSGLDEVLPCHTSVAEALTAPTRPTTARSPRSAKLSWSRQGQRIG